MQKFGDAKAWVLLELTSPNELRLDAATLARTAAVVRNGRHVFDLLDGHASRLQGGDRAFTARTGPLTRTSISRTPNLAAFSAACWAATWPANGRALARPLENHMYRTLAQHKVSPLVSVIVTVVLLKVARIWQSPPLRFYAAYDVWPLPQSWTQIQICLVRLTMDSIAVVDNKMDAVNNRASCRRTSK